jgi:cysteine-rich repeat protein
MEACDDGNGVETDACLSSCTQAECGDMVTWAGVEECDDGNAVGGDGCSGCKKDKCGNGVIDAGEHCDIALKPPFVGVGCKPGVCLYDFSQVSQLYCFGTCTWAGAQSCDKADADLFCKLRTGNPNSAAIGFQTAPALPTFGFSCPGYNNNLGPMPQFGVGVNVWYQPGNLQANHGNGTVIVDPNCTNP